MTMVRRTSDSQVDPVDRDERLGEAIEAYLALAEAGQAPEPSAFAAGYPDLGEDLVAALDGLALVRGLVGDASGPGHRLESGRRVAGYRIVRELGRGGMGIVYEAVHVGLDRPVALKVLGSSAAPDSSGRRRFLNEARTAAGLHHTHIVPVFDVGQVGGLCYYAMQRIEGSGLDRVIKHLRRDRSVAAGSTYSGRPTPPPPSPPPASSGFTGESTATWAGLGSRRPVPGLDLDLEDEDESTPFVPPRGSAYYRWVASVGKQASEALAHAHQRGVIHRDVKPSNLLVDARGVVWMADFGLARRLADPSQTQLDSLLGTPRYMSPEQARTGPIDGRSDVYSLGATLYELLTLRPPFEGKTAAELIDQIVGRDPAPIRQFDPRVSRDLETIVTKALHKRPGDRYATAADLADDLGRYLNHEPVRARRIGPLGRAWRVARRHPSLTAVSAAATAAVVASSTIAYVRVLHERDEATKARVEAQDVAGQLEVANRATRDALRSQYLLNAEVVRASDAADRRSAGLALLEKAAGISAGPGDRARLRDEAVAFLAIRDVERRPEIPAEERAQGLVFGPDGRHVAALSEDGSTVRFWDATTRALVETHVLGPRPAPAPEPGPGGGRGRGRGGFNPMRDPWPRIVAAGLDVAVIHPDGKGIRLLDAATGAVSGNLLLIGRPGGSDDPAFEAVGLAASADGRRLVTVERRAAGDSRDGRTPPTFRVRLWDAKVPDRPLRTLFPDPNADPAGTPDSRSAQPGSPPRWPMIAISPDGRTAAVSLAFDSEVVLWSRDGQEKATIDTEARLTALALGPQGVLAAAGNGAIHLWNLSTRGGPASLPSLHPQASVHQLRFSADAAGLLAVGGFGAAVELWDVSMPTKPLARLSVGDDWRGLALAPGGRTLAVGLPTSLAFWAVVDPMAQSQLAGFRERPHSLAFSAAGELAATTPVGELKRWSIGRCPTTSETVATAQPSAIAFDARGRLIAQERDRVAWLAPDDAVVALAKLPKPSRPDDPLGRRGDGFPPSAPEIARSSDGRTLAMTRGDQVFLGRLDADGTPGPIARLDLPGLPAPSRPAGGRPGVAGAPAPARVEAGPPEPPGRGRAGRDGDRMTPPFGRNFWRGVALSPDGGRLYLVAMGLGEVTAWSIRDGRAERLPWSVPGNFASLALSPDGRTLAAGDLTGAVLLIDAEAGRLLHRLAHPEGDVEGPAFALAFAPDGSGLAVGTRDQVRLWSISAGAAIPFLRLPGHRGQISSLAYAPDGRHLASGGDDKTVKVWDLDRVRSQLAKIGLD